MVKIDYEPHRLHSTVRQVQKQHPSITELTRGECSTDVKDFVYRVCSLSEKELNIEKIYLPYRRYIQIATYLTSGNYYDLNHDNLLYLLKGMAASIQKYAISTCVSENCKGKRCNC